MADTKFDYKGVAAEYKNFKEIVGDAGDPASVAGILNTANEEMDELCNGSDQAAIWGPLGQQLKLNWDNFSSDFPNFIAVFDNWAASVAQAGNNYGFAEEQIKAMFEQSKQSGFAGRDLNGSPLSNSYYQQYTASNYSTQWEDDLRALGDKWHALTGAEYIDTGTVAWEDSQRKWRIAGDILILAGGANIASRGLVVAWPKITEWAGLKLAAAKESLGKAGSVIAKKAADAKTVGLDGVSTARTTVSEFGKKIVASMADHPVRTAVVSAGTGAVAHELVTD